MNLSLRIFCAGIGACAWWMNAAADHPSVVFGSGQGGPLNTMSVVNMSAATWAVGMRTEVINFDPLSDLELAGLAGAGVDDVHSIDEIISTSASIAYGVSDNLDVSIRIPWIWRDNIREGELEDGEAEAHAHGDTDGIGDVQVLANYRLWSRDKLDFALQGGVKAPTGKTGEADGGERLEAEFQPGTGSWDFLIGGAVGKTFGRFGVHANLLYNATTEGSQDTEFGDALLYNLAVVFDPNLGHDHDTHEHSTLFDSIRWELMVELNGEQRWKDQVAGATDANSGGNTLYASPGARASFGQVSAFVSFGLPVVDDPNGWQSDIDFRLNGGVAVGF